jgi:tRNA-specific 2-thiouridylase
MKDELLANGCVALEANWLFEPEDEWIACTVKIRYNAEPVAGQVRQKMGISPNTEGELEVRFEEPQFAVAPGQAVVCYNGDAVICGGWIKEACISETMGSIQR